jgi:hypothetical protein
VTPSTKPQQYDVIVVGSGAAGGQSAYTLSMEGAAGRRDLGYIGNVPLPRFDGPPAELLRKLGLGPEAA